jgi:hypothetical protein
MAKRQTAINVQTSAVGLTSSSQGIADGLFWRQMDQSPLPCYLLKKQEPSFRAQ